jgi:steroid delta-isomerase-like uncharacterized protein
MAARDNRSVARRFVEEILDTGDWSNAGDVIAADVVMHHPSAPEPVRGLEAVSRAIGSFRLGFPDLRVAVDDMIAEGDKVVVRWTASGTHTGDLFGLPSTGRSVRVRGISILRVARGKIVEATIEEDTLGMFQQIGYSPQSTPSAV